MYRKKQENIHEEFGLLKEKIVCFWFGLCVLKKSFCMMHYNILARTIHPPPL